MECAVAPVLCTGGSGYVSEFKYKRPTSSSLFIGMTNQLSLPPQHVLIFSPRAGPTLVRAEWWELIGASLETKIGPYTRRRREGVTSSRSLTLSSYNLPLNLLFPLPILPPPASHPPRESCLWGLAHPCWGHYSGTTGAQNCRERGIL